MKITSGVPGMVNITDIGIRDIINFLKIQIPCKFSVINNETGRELLIVWVLERLKNQRVIVANDFRGKDRRECSYDELLEDLKTLLNAEGEFNMKIRKEDYDSKKPLIDIISNIRQDIISGCSSIDYKDGMFSIIGSRDNKNYPNDLYYWEETGSLFAFSDKQVNIQYESAVSSIEQILC